MSKKCLIMYEDVCKYIYCINYQKCTCAFIQLNIVDNAESWPFLSFKTIQRYFHEKLKRKQNCSTRKQKLELKYLIDKENLYGFFQLFFNATKNNQIPTQNKRLLICSSWYKPANCNCKTNCAIRLFRVIRMLFLSAQSYYSFLEVSCISYLLNAKIYLRTYYLVQFLLD